MGERDISKTLTLRDGVTQTLNRISGGTLKYKKNLQDLKKTANSAWSAVKVGAAAGAAAIVGTALGLGALVSKTAEAGDRIDKMSQQLGFSTKGFQEMEYVLGQNGMEIGQLAGGMKSVTERMNEMKQGSKESSALFKQLGLDASISGKSQEEAFKSVISALQAMPPGAAKAAAAQKAFGGSVQELMPLINSQSGSMDGLIDKYRKLNGGLTDKQVKDSVAFKRSLDNLKQSITGAFNALSAPALPIFIRGVEWLIDKVQLAKNIAVDAFESIRNSIASNQEKFDSISSSLLEIKDKIFGAFSPGGTGGGAISWFISTGIPAVVGGIADILNGATSMYNFINSNWSLISPIIYGIVGGLVAYKTIQMGIAAWTGIVTAATWAWNAAMNANPIGLIVLGIGALIFVGMLLINNWESVKLAGMQTWNVLVGATEWAVNACILGANTMLQAFKFAWDSIEFAGKSIWNGILSAGQAGVNGFIGLINSMVTKALDGINSLIRGANSVASKLGMGTINELSFNGVGKVSFDGAKAAANAPKWDSDMNIIPKANFDGAKFSDDSIMAQTNKAKKKSAAKQGSKDKDLTRALADNTEALKFNATSTAENTKESKNNTQANKKNTQATKENSAKLSGNLTGMDVADSLLARIERHTYGT